VSIYFLFSSNSFLLIIIFPWETFETILAFFPFFLQTLLFPGLFWGYFNFSWLEILKLELDFLYFSICFHNWSPSSLRTCIKERKKILKRFWEESLPSCTIELSLVFKSWRSWIPFFFVGLSSIARIDFYKLEILWRI